MLQNLVTLATTDAEKEAIYRLRYEVYIEEMGGGLHHNSEADKETRRLRDALDAGGIISWVCKTAGLRPALG